MKRILLVCLAVWVLVLPVGADPSGVGSARFSVVEATIPAIQKALETRLITTEQLVQMYLTRIATYDPASRRVTDAEGRVFYGLNSYLHVNARALDEARASDEARHRGNIKSPLFGVPVVLKDNIDTADMPTTAGSVALRGSIPLSDAFVTKKLREAGAIILGKATLTEFANFLTNGMPAGYSSLGQYGYNPYDPRPDPRTGTDALGRPLNDGRPVLTPGGSSSGPGIAVAASLAAVGVGTETSGSILSPGTANMLVGIKPTVGLISRDGIIPITADQDTAGPMARTVTDAAILLGVLAGYDPADPATAACLTFGNCFSDYTGFLDKKALIGARIAVPPFPSNRAAVMNSAIEVLRAQGAYVEIIPVLAPQLPGCPSTPLPGAYPPSATPAPGQTLRCSTVLFYGFKRDLNAYFAAHLDPAAPVKSLQDVIAFNTAHAADSPSSVKYGQDLALFSQLFDVSAGSADTIRYELDRAEDIVRSRGALDAVYNGPDGVPSTGDDFDAILFSGNSGAATPAKAGYPSIVVPGGFFDNSNSAFPTDFKPLPGPAGVTFSGPAFSEGRLIALAYAFEQATQYRVAPPTAPALAGDAVERRR
jgi:amidase